MIMNILAAFNAVLICPSGAIQCLTEFVYCCDIDVIVFMKEK